MPLIRALKPDSLMRGLTLLLLAQASLPTTALPPTADAHVHYIWTRTDHTSPVQAVAIFKQAGVHLAVVFGTPPELVMRIKALASDWLIPGVGPLDGRRDWVAWQFDPGVVDAEVGYGNGERLFGRPR